jgi:hypothetical protein
MSSLPPIQNFAAVQLNQLQFTYANGANTVPFSYNTANMSIVLQAPGAVLPNLSFPASINPLLFSTKRGDLTVTAPSGPGIFDIGFAITGFTRR